MPPPHSAGILLFRQAGGQLQVLLVKPGGPFWKNKDAGAWMIPKGGIEPGETPIEAALREFEEETGTRVKTVPFPLAKVRQAGGKWVEAFAVEGDLDPETLTSTEFEMEWPPRSDTQATFPEVDRAEWFSPEAARRKILAGQAPLLDRLLERLDQGAESAA